MNFPRYFILGLVGSYAIEEVAEVLSNHLAVWFQERHSSLYGGTYFTTRVPQPVGNKEEISISANRTPLGDLEFPEAIECKVLIEWKNGQTSLREAVKLINDLFPNSVRLIR